MIPFRVLCIDSTSKPESIPNSKWVKKNQVYTVVQVDKLNMQNKKLGYKIYEIDIDPYYPYQYFGAWRFAVMINDISQEAQKEYEKVITTLIEEIEKDQIELIQHAEILNIPNN